MNRNQEGMTLQMRVRAAKLKNLARKLPNTYLGDEFIRRQRIKESGLTLVSPVDMGGDHG